MESSIPVTIEPLLWESFNGDFAAWDEKIRHFTQSLPDSILGRKLYVLLKEIFRADQAGMYLRSHSLLMDIKTLLMQAGALEAFAFAMGG